jgi:methylglyoxal synthase
MKTIALIAHDQKKEEMLEFARERKINNKELLCQIEKNLLAIILMS